MFYVQDQRVISDNCDHQTAGPADSRNMINYGMKETVLFALAAVFCFLEWKATANNYRILSSIVRSTRDRYYALYFKGKVRYSILVCALYLIKYCACIHFRAQ